MNMFDDLQAEAQALGFFLIGVNKPTHPAHYEAYTQWIERGLHGNMDYLEGTRAFAARSNPASLLTGSKTILSLATPYDHPELNNRRSDGLRGRVAAYAWGIDYHKLIPPRLEKLAASFQQITGKPIAHRGYTDTGPILERDLAQQAGLGWIGKNTCLIHPKRGSFFFLSELFLELELEPTPAFKEDRCGTCLRCIDSCPTGCIRADRTLDSRRCISYLTIENKGSIPPELRPAIGDWVFGCDICQAVCPWNQRFAPAHGDPALALIPEMPDPNLIEALRLTPETFNIHYRQSPLRRAKRRGYLRNVCTVLGNLGNPAAVPALTETLNHEAEPLVRGHAAWALGRIGTSAALQKLSSAANHESDEFVRKEIEAALAG